MFCCPSHSSSARSSASASAQNDDPDICLIPYRAGQCQPVFTGQYQVEDHKINRGLRHDPAHPGAVLRRRNPVVALARQIFLNQVADLALIIDDQDVTVVHLRLPHIMVRPGDRSTSRFPDGSFEHSTISGYKLLHKIGWNASNANWPPSLPRMSRLMGGGRRRGSKVRTRLAPGGRWIRTSGSGREGLWL